VNSNSLYKLRRPVNTTKLQRSWLINLISLSSIRLLVSSYNYNLI
jgi:hypothetical protein